MQDAKMTGAWFSTFGIRAECYSLNCPFSSKASESGSADYIRAMYTQHLLSLRSITLYNIATQCPEIPLGNEMEDTYQVATRLLLEQRFDLHCHGKKSSGSNSSRVSKEKRLDFAFHGFLCILAMDIFFFPVTSSK